MLSPKRLQKCDTIGIVSPSAAITEDIRSQLDEGAKILKELGFRVKYAKNALNIIDGYSAGTPEEKAEDINSMFADPEVDAIMCSQGGDNANSCLSLIDYELIKRNPKIFIGISDITVLLLSIYKKTGLVTFHGNDFLWGFGMKPTKYDIDEFKLRLMDGEIGEINRNSEWNTIRKGRAEGILMGGNLKCMLKSAGTEFFPDFKDAILFVEAYEITSGMCDAHFHQLKQMGVFDKIKGVIVGYIYGLQATKKKVA